jgi:DNA-binding LytR/AlgR family response regulator
MNVYLQVYHLSLLRWMLRIFPVSTTIGFNPSNIRIPSLLRANASPMPDAEKPAGEAATHTTLIIKDNNKTELLRFQEILYLEFENNRVEIQTIHKRYIVYRSLRSVEQELDPALFIRIHRSAIVNRHFIIDIIHFPSGDGYVELTNGEEICYARNYKQGLINLSEDGKIGR